METKIIILTKAHRGGINSESFSGRPNGEAVRKELRLDEKDNDNNKYVFKMPEDTISINPSFYLGLLYNSLVHLKSLSKFDNKYSFDLSSFDPESKECINANLEECRRKAVNELSGTTGLDSIFK